MERYLEFRIDEQTTELKMEAFLKKNAGLTKRQISQAKFRPDGITRNGVRCRVTETIYPGDVIRVCLEEAGTASAHLENYNDGIRSKDLSDFHSNRASAPVSETSFSLNILYEDTDILAVDKPAGMVTHPTGMHYTDSLSNLVAGYFREKNEQVCVRPGGGCTAGGGDLRQAPILHRKLAYSLYSKPKIPLAPAILFATEKISVQLHPSPKSLYGNFPIHNVRCRNKEIAVPCSPMRLHGTGCVG